MKRFVAKLGAFVLLLVVGQLLVSAAFPPQVPREVLRLEEHLQDGADVIYVGDSTLTYPVGEVTTGELLQEMLPARSHRLPNVYLPKRASLSLFVPPVLRTKVRWRMSTN